MRDAAVAESGNIPQQEIQSLNIGMSHKLTAVILTKECNQMFLFLAGMA